MKERCMAKETTIETQVKAMYTKANDAIAELYTEGTLEWLRDIHPKTYAEIMEHDDIINDKWKATVEGKCSLNDKYIHHKRSFFCDTFSSLSLSF